MTSMTLLYGKPVADTILAKARQTISQTRIRPGLAVVLVGDDPASHIYVGIKEKTALALGMLFEKHVFSQNTKQATIITAIKSLNQRADIHGIIVQLPLPEGFDTDSIITAIDPEKDADGFHQETLKRLFVGDKQAYPVLPTAVLELLRATGQSIVDKNAVVVVNSDLLGKVMTTVLSLEGVQTQFILAEHIAREEERLQSADIVISACGVPNMIIGAMLKAGVIGIDAGITRVGESVVGDMEAKSVGQIAAFLTPVPGGVGPVTVATLLARVTDMALRKLD